MMEKSYKWVKRCIESCQDIWQLQTANKLIEMFIANYGKENTKELADDLYDTLVEKQNVISG